MTAADPGRTTGPSAPAGPSDEELVRAIAGAVTAHPAVARLDAGVFGDIVTYLPGRWVQGVRLGRAGEPVEIGVVLRLDRPIPEVAEALRVAVAAVAGGRRVDVTVTDLLAPGDQVRTAGRDTAAWPSTEVGP